MTLPIPTPSEQLNFFTKLQRIFSEGEFTATYKFALLISLADLAVELGSDNGNELILTNRQIGYKFISPTGINPSHTELAAQDANQESLYKITALRQQ